MVAPEAELMVADRDDLAGMKRLDQLMQLEYDRDKMSMRGSGFRSSRVRAGV